MTTIKRRANGKGPRPGTTVIQRVKSERPAPNPPAKPPTKPKKGAR